MTNKPTIKIDISIEIPVDVAETTIQQLTNFASAVRTIPNQAPALAMPEQVPVYQENSNVAKGLEALGNKAYEEQQIAETEKVEAEERKYLRQQELKKSRKLYDQRCVQSYREYRRICDDYEKPYHAAKAIGAKWGWPAHVTMDAISKRRKVVKVFIKKKQKQAIMRMVWDKKTNKEIAAKLGVHPKTISDVVREMKANLNKGGFYG